MHTVDTIAIASTPDVVYRLAADVERWPEILPHYRWVYVLETRGPDECIVEMAARRDRIPVWWRSIQRCYPAEHRIVYKHIGGATTGMDVEWTIVPTSGGARARITHDILLPWPIIGPLAAWVMCDAFVSYIASQTLRGIAAAAEELQSHSASRVSTSC
ncbi:MAG TPA: SRPBCC family protein [Ktedonobacterales bacterium]|jgi:ribosome-associated toxin RatA of RatAB toxin-antitoxin module